MTYGAEHQTRMTRGIGRGGYWRAGRAAIVLVAVLLVGACEDILAVRPDSATVDVEKNPPQLIEAMNGTTVDLNFAYDIWIMGQGMFGNEMNSVSFLRWEMANRIPSNTIGLSAGTGASSPNDRSVTANFPAFYAYLQAALATTSRLQARILAGEFPTQITGDPKNSIQYAQLALYRGFEIIWLADVWCDFVLDGLPKVYTSQEGWALAAKQFDQVLAATGATADQKRAAYAGLARVNRLLGNWTAARDNALQVPNSFTFQTTYAATPQANVNRLWFHLWSFGEHTVSAKWRNLTLDGTATPDPRMALQANARNPIGTLDVIYAPFKYASAGASINVTSGVEAQFIRAEAAIAVNDLVGAVTLLNAIRAQRGVTLAWAPATLDRNTVLDKLIDERGRTLHLEGTRVGDLRFYKKAYGKDLWHTTIPQGSLVGPATCHPLQQAEIDNIVGMPAYTFQGDSYAGGGKL